MDKITESTVRYEYREPRAPLFLKATWVRIETSNLGGIVVERISPCEKPAPKPARNGQLAFQF
jgi:hypothetical protein